MKGVFGCNSVWIFKYSKEKKSNFKFGANYKIQILILRISKKNCLEGNPIKGRLI